MQAVNERMKARAKPDIRKITRMIPPDGNLVQGQSELSIDAGLARAAAEEIAASRNHYGPAEGVADLRRAVAAKIGTFNGVGVDPEAAPLELLVTPGGTGGLVAFARTYLVGASALVFEPYYPYHRRIVEEMGGRTETLPLRGERLELDADELRARCRELRGRAQFPLRAVIVCTPVNPTGKVFTRDELERVAAVCREFDLLCVSDEVYEHYVAGPAPHTSIATLEGMWERTVTVNSFSKSWNISGWRLGYTYGRGDMVAPLAGALNVFYVCSPTPLQRALGRVLMAEPSYYARLTERFRAKRERVVGALAQLGFRVYDSGSTFYVWARIPDGYGDAMELNEMLMRAEGVAAVPGSAFADTDAWDDYMRVCIAREDSVLDSALGKLRRALGVR